MHLGQIRWHVWHSDAGGLQDNDLQMMEDMAKYLRAEEVPYDGRHSEMKNVIW